MEQGDQQRLPVHLLRLLLDQSPAPPAVHSAPVPWVDAGEDLPGMTFTHL